MSSNAPASQKPLLAAYRDYIDAAMSADGFELTHAIGQSTSGELSVYALAMPPQQIYEFVVAVLRKGEIVELIFAIDRFARPDQGTTLNDLLAGFHFTSRSIRPFIVEYQFEPRIVKPFDWDNSFWNLALISELHSATKSSAGRQS